MNSAPELCRASYLPPRLSVGGGTYDRGELPSLHPNHNIYPASTKDEHVEVGSAGWDTRGVIGPPWRKHENKQATTLICADFLTVWGRNWGWNHQTFCCLFIKVDLIHQVIRSLTHV